MALTLLGCLAVGSGTGLTGGLISCSPQPSPETVRPLSGAEAQRLAIMRVTNYRDGRAGLHATIGPPGAETEVTGGVDWGRQLVYLTVGGSGAGEYRGLLQSVPGLVATRPADPPATSPEPGGSPPTDITPPPELTPPPGLTPPPVLPPGDGWRVRRWDTSDPTNSPLDSFLALVFAAAADRPDRPEALERSEARWLGTDHAGGARVDVLLGPAVPQSTWDVERSSPAPTSLAAMGGAVRYWLDADARLHRLEALLGENVAAQVDLDRSAKPELRAVAALGGAPVRPRPVTSGEAEQLAEVPATNRARGGATISLAVPTLPATDLQPGTGPAVNLRGAGWVDWYSDIAYLTVHEIDEPSREMLLRADPIGVAMRSTTGRATDDGPAPTGTTPGTGRTEPEPAERARSGKPDDTELPPLPPPTERNWAYLEWRDRADNLGGLDIDLLVGEAFAMGDRAADDAARLRRSAVWLRRDVVHGTKVTVFEMPKAPEAGTPRGQARMRYWIDSTGLLRRLELRTRTGAFAQLDLFPGEVPALPWVPTG